MFWCTGKLFLSKFVNSLILLLIKNFKDINDFKIYLKILINHKNLSLLKKFNYFIVKIMMQNILRLDLLYYLISRALFTFQYYYFLEGSYIKFYKQPQIIVEMNYRYFDHFYYFDMFLDLKIFHWFLLCNRILRPIFYCW